MTEPDYATWQKALKLRVDGKTGRRELTPEESRFLLDLYEQYPEWYKTDLEREAFYKSRPFGSQALWHGDRESE